MGNAEYMGIVSQAITNTDKMGDHIMLDLEEWALVLNKMLRFHFNLSEEIKAVVQAIRTEMKPELIPLAEDKANFGKGGLWSMKSTSCSTSLPIPLARWTSTTSTLTSSRIRCSRPSHSSPSLMSSEKSKLKSWRR